MEARLGKVFGRFKKSELPGVALELGLELLPRAKSKKELVSLLVDHCMETNTSPSELLRVELSYISGDAIPKSAIWKVYKLEYAHHTSTTVDMHLFTKKLQFFLADIYNYEMVDVLKPSGYWLCMHISDQCHAPYTCYILLRPPSPYLFLTGVRKAHLVTLLEAISLTLDSVSYIEMDLSGKDLKSLIELVCNQHSQGTRSSYRLNQVDVNPLLVAGRYPRPLTSHTPPTSGSPSHSLEDTRNTAQRHEAAAVDSFGTNPLPVIEKFTFKLLADVGDDVGENSDSVRCKVELSGSSVLEGMKAAIANGCFSLPIPETISHMTSYASTSVTMDTTQ